MTEPERTERPLAASAALAYARYLATERPKDREVRDLVALCQLAEQEGRTLDTALESIAGLVSLAVLAFVRQATTHAAHPDLADMRARLLGVIDDALQAKFATDVVLRGMVAGAFQVLEPKAKKVAAAQRGVLSRFRPRGGS